MGQNVTVYSRKLETQFVCRVFVENGPDINVSGNIRIFSDGDEGM
jgi:hypothetical protein